MYVSYQMSYNDISLMLKHLSTVSQMSQPKYLSKLEKMK